MIEKPRSVLSLKGNLSNGLFALVIVSLIVLGCTCNEKDGFNWGSNSNTGTSSGSDDDGTNGKDDDKPEEFKADEKVIPTDEQAAALVEATLMAFDDAVQRADFSDFHETVSKGLQRSASADGFKKSFQVFIDKKIDLSEVRGKTPKFDPKPFIMKKTGVNQLFLEGRYQLSKFPVRFELAYMVEDEQWKLFSIGVYTGNK